MSYKIHAGRAASHTTYADRVCVKARVPLVSVNQALRVVQPLRSYLLLRHLVGGVVVLCSSCKECEERVRSARTGYSKVSTTDAGAKESEGGSG